MGGGNGVSPSSTMLDKPSTWHKFKRMLRKTPSGDEEPRLHVAVAPVVVSSLSTPVAVPGGGLASLLDRPSTGQAPAEEDDHGLVDAQSDSSGSSSELRTAVVGDNPWIVDEGEDGEGHIEEDEDEATEAQELLAVLTSAGLGRYESHLLDFGVTSLEDCRDTTVLSEDALKDEVGMLEGDIVVFRRAVGSSGGGQAAGLSGETPSEEDAK